MFSARARGNRVFGIGTAALSYILARKRTDRVDASVSFDIPGDRSSNALRVDEISLTFDLRSRP